jgi:hypothetical protein
VLLIVPGLILLTWWCLIVPVIVFEGKFAVYGEGVVDGSRRARA